MVSIILLENIILKVVGPINWMLDTVPFTIHCYSMDWHPPDHVSFLDTVHRRTFAINSKVKGKNNHENVENFFIDSGPIFLQGI